MPAQGSSQPRSVMQRSHILQLFCDSTASSDTEKLQIYERNVQWLHSYLSTFSSKMYTSSHHQIHICITLQQVTSIDRVCFESREAQQVVLDQLQAIILEVNTLLECAFNQCIELSLTHDDISECQQSSGSSRRQTQFLTLRNNLVQLHWHIFSVHAVRLINADVRWHVSQSCSDQFKSKAREVACETADEASMRQSKARAKMKSHLPTK